jgi:7-cyano-7-deazaguanine synthase
VRCVSLLSGGLDSLVATVLARREHEVVLALTCDYGQRAAPREIAAARAQAERLGLPHLLVELPWLGALGGNALTERDRDLPQPAPEELDRLDVTLETAQAVWVPNRNGVLTNVAAAIAESRGAEAVLCGFNAEEGATFPDNTPEFLAAADQLWRYSTANQVRLLSPTIAMDKRAIVRAGRAAGAPLELVWSCYTDQPEPCGQCESCRRLERAIED